MKNFPILAIFMLILIPTALAVSYPKITDFVTDQADIISPEYEQKITELAKQIEQETTVEIAVVTVKSLEGLSKEQYALELAEQNGIGKEDVDNGLLILVAIEERVYRFEVGYGLEGAIPDANKVSIGTRIIEPHFKQGQYGKGIHESLILVKALIQEDSGVISEYQSKYFVQRGGSSLKLWVYIIFFFLFFISSFFARGRRRGGFMFVPLFLPGGRTSGGSGGFGSSGFGGFGGGSFGGGGFGGSF